MKKIFEKHETLFCVLLIAFMSWQILTAFKTSV